MNELCGLVISDDFQMREMLAAHLRILGWAQIFQCGLSEAILFFTEKKPSHVIVIGSDAIANDLRAIAKKCRIVRCDYDRRPDKDYVSFPLCRQELDEALAR